MPHLNLDLDYFEHRKTGRLVGLLGKGAEVLPIKLWRYCGKFHAEDGRLSGYTEQEIEATTGWWGKPGEAVDALLKVGFLDKTEDGYSVHDWLESQGHIAAYKKKGRDMALARWGRAVSNADSITGGAGGEDAQQCQSQQKKPTKPTVPKKPTRKRAAGAAKGGEALPEFYDLIPESLRVPEFLSAWAAWVEHRRVRKPVYTEISARRALPRLEAEGVAAAVDRIDRCISNSYQGLFFQGEKSGAASGTHKPTRGERDAAMIDAALAEAEAQ